MTTTDEANGSKLYKLYRPDGSLYATQEWDHGASVSTLYGTDPKDAKLIVKIFATPAANFDAVSKEPLYGTAPPLPARYLPSRLSRKKSECLNNVTQAFPWRIPSTFHWLWNRNSTPSNLDRDLTLTNLRSSHTEWQANTNWCGYADNSAVSFSYDGVTTEAFGRNNLNTIGWGDTDAIGCIGAAACTMAWYSETTLQEADVRYNKNLAWRNGSYNAYDVWSVAAHENGHIMGLDDVRDASNVMRRDIRAYDITNRKLGKGDALWNNREY